MTEFNLRPGPEFEIAPGRTALIVVDMQRMGLVPGVGLSPLHEERSPESYRQYQDYVRATLIPNNVRLVEGFRALGWRIAFTTAGSFLPDRADSAGPRRRKDLEFQRRTGIKTIFAIGDYEHGVIDELGPRPDDLLLNKVGSDIFIGTGLDQLLRWMGLDTLVFTGVGTCYCVESSVRHASDLGYACIVAADACGTSDMTLHEHSLRVMKQRYAMVCPTAEILEKLPRAREAPAAGHASREG